MTISVPVWLYKKILQSIFNIFLFFFIISAADLYIKDFIHPIVKEGHMEAVPLRIYYRHRWVQTVPEVVLQYCLLEMSASQGNFRMPSREEVDKHRIIITTLKTARYLCDLDLPQGQCPQEIQNLSMIFVFFKNLFFFLLIWVKIFEKKFWIRCKSYRVCMYAVI